MTPREHADALVHCFTGYVSRRDDAVNRAHLRVASDWLRLIDAERPSVAEIDALASDVEAVGWAGSATVDLQLGVRAWAPLARRRAILR
jgi:hypothetical protein